MNALHCGSLCTFSSVILNMVFSCEFLFLFALENHILEDVNKCVIALQEKDVDGLDRTAGAIRGRAARVVHVVTSEMDNYEPGIYTEKVLEATKLLTNTGINQNTRPEIICFALNVCSYSQIWCKISQNLLLF